MRQTQTPASPDMKAVYYSEDRCALRWPLLFSGLYAPIIAIALAVGCLIAERGALAWLLFGLFMVAFACWLVLRGETLPYVWPASIRLDSEGVHIGGMRWAERHPGRRRQRRKRAMRWQCAQEFYCPWEGVIRIGVTQRRDRTRKLVNKARYGNGPALVGNMAAPFMRAALVAWVDQPQAQLPEFRRRPDRLLTETFEPGVGRPIWVIPTRRPEKLQAALMSAPIRRGIVSDPLSDAFVDSEVHG
jgi:hypothetical protein